MARSRRPPGFLVALVVGAAGLLAVTGACDDDRGAEGVRDRLNALPGVTARIADDDVDGAALLGVTFELPVDHADLAAGTFPLHTSLRHRDSDSPLVVLTSGYFDYYGGRTVELTEALAANQVSIEHRFFGASQPDLAADPGAWRYLTIRQMADDQHAVVAALRSIYAGAAISTGASKGGMTAVFHRRFYPDDVDATVAYVAPLSLGAPDARYASFLDTVGPSSCRAALRALGTELIANRRDMLEVRAAAEAAAKGYAYTRVSLPAAVESSIVALEFVFWQYFGVEACEAIPAPSATDDDVWGFLEGVSPVSDSADEPTAAFAPYVYQAYAELGFPALGGAHLEAYYRFGDADYAGALPVAQPAYDDGAAMRDIEVFAATAPRLLFVYGAWDPWTAGAFPQAVASLQFVQPQGTHRTELADLSATARAEAGAALASWTGLPVRFGDDARARAPSPHTRPVPPRIPPSILRAMRPRH